MSMDLVVYADDDRVLELQYFNVQQINMSYFFFACETGKSVEGIIKTNNPFWDSIMLCGVKI